MSSPRPVTVVEELLREFDATIADPSVPMEENEVRHTLRKLRAAQRSAQPDEFARLFNTIGITCGRLKDYQGALDAHRNAAKYDQSTAMYLNNAASALIELKRFDEALETLRRAHAKTVKSSDFEVLARLNASEAYFALGDEKAARREFLEGVMRADPTNRADMFVLSTQAAIIGADQEAVEFFARYIALATKTDLGDTPAVEIIRAAPSETKARLVDLPALAGVIARATESWDAIVPDEHSIATEILLPDEAVARIVSLAERQSAPSDALRQLFNAHA